MRPHRWEMWPLINRKGPAISKGSCPMPEEQARMIFYWVSFEQVDQVQSTYNSSTGQWETSTVTITLENTVFVDRNVAASGGTAISYTTLDEMKGDEAQLVVKDSKGCVVESSITTLVRPEVIREYDLCFRWKTPATEEDTQIIPQVQVTSTGIASQSMGQSIKSQAEQCVSAKAAAFGADYKQYCLSTDFLNDQVDLTYEVTTYHHTLYYYDRANNLVRTVPPKGVNPLTGAELSRTHTPSHELVTTYNYNNLGQLVRQNSPDGGQTSFIYNNLGQLRYSQNANQSQSGKLSYTKYDELSRIIEVGEATLGTDYTVPGGATFPTATFAQLADESFLELDKQSYQTLTAAGRYPTAAHGLSQQTLTTYNDAAAVDYNGEGQSYLRNRVSHSEAINKSGESVKTYYSYDVHGNVKWLIQEVPGLGTSQIGYDYDLLSGNVLKVKYNEGASDQFFHKYEYDEDNRIRGVFTSKNDITWENDASYEYFDPWPFETRRYWRQPGAGPGLCLYDPWLAEGHQQSG